jgi:hypothetical protein
MTEAELSAQIALEVGSLKGVRIFRNTTGTGWQGKIVEKRGELTILQHARFTTFGLAKGSGDFIGLTDDGKFLSLEIKTEKGKPSPEQIAWSVMVNRFGGIAGIVRSPEEAIELIKRGVLK